MEDHLGAQVAADEQAWPVLGRAWPEPCGAEGQRWACAEEASLSSEAWRGESGCPPPLEAPLGDHRDGKVPWASVS